MVVKLESTKNQIKSIFIISLYIYYYSNLKLISVAKLKKKKKTKTQTNVRNYSASVAQHYIL